MKKVSAYLSMVAVVLFTAMPLAAGLGPPAGNIWADGTLYRTIGTPTELPNKGLKDGMYVIEGLSGQHPVSESKPGDQDYNGGRWQQYILEFTEEGMEIHDPDGDGAVNFQLQSWEQVQEHIGFGHLMLVGMGDSFVCPLIKK